MSELVMAVPGLNPGICPGHPRLGCRKKDVDARDKPAQDGDTIRGT
jgi:hypothetical protein